MDFINNSSDFKKTLGIFWITLEIWWIALKILWIALDPHRQTSQPRPKYIYIYYNIRCSLQPIHFLVSGPTAASPASNSNLWPWRAWYPRWRPGRFASVRGIRVSGFPKNTMGGSKHHGGSSKWMVRCWKSGTSCWNGWWLGLALFHETSISVVGCCWYIVWYNSARSFFLHLHALQPSSIHPNSMYI